ncbi:MAG: sugar ABC transporter ATP-binding protein [Bryobacteraceae bacterium]
MKPLLKLERISKTFGGVAALDGVSFEVLPGEIHALVGENGAGKSTLMNIASGVMRPDSGAIIWDGRPVAPAGPREAQDLGISFVHQELALAPQLSAAENVFLGRHPARRGCVRWKEINQRAGELLRELGHDLDPRRPAGELSIGEQQVVEIARALSFNARLIIMDEPTAPLSGHETARLLRVIARLKERGASVVYISHRLKEIYQGPDRVTVLRDGRRVACAPVADMPQDLLVRHMVGRDVKPRERRTPALAGAEALRVEGLTARGRFADVSLAVRYGEVCGLAGLVGAGRTDVLETIFGACRYDGGRVFLNGREVRIRSPRDAIRHGVALVPDDRKGKGLIAGAPLAWNMALATQRRFVIRPRAEQDMARRMIGELRVRAAGPGQSVSELSGGNQQKVVLARWLLADAKIFLFDEPTRGVDVAAKAEIHELIRDLAARGAAVLLVSSELEEILQVADRILVMHRGRLAGEMTREDATEERIMKVATGGSD